MAARRILLVENHPLNQKLVMHYLAAKGFTVELAVNATQAEAALAAATYDLVLMDVSLPGEDGLSLLKRMRTQGKLKIPVVALTAHAMPYDRARALDAGCVEHLCKPVALGHLLEVTERLAGGVG